MTDYEPAANQTDLYGTSYFATRYGQDPKRTAQFRLEAELLRRYVSLSGSVLDVGCSTGEFLETVGWTGPRYGMEIAEEARAEAERNGVRFDRDLFTERDVFDVVIFRGTIQHVDEPFRFIKHAFEVLRPGGYVFFLATPNANSPLYRQKRTLPFLDPPRNFYVPDDLNLPNALRNYGFEVVEIRYPYWRTPYRRALHDHWRFLKNLVVRGRFFPHAFWYSSMELVVRKPPTS